LLQFAAAREVHDERLWTMLSQATGAAGNSTALVGSCEQVAESLLDYVAVGATTLLIRGYDPLLDTAAYADLIRLVHEQAGQCVRHHHRLLERILIADEAQYADL
jgi:alkanesulfonate monooxygenase